jgi:hypothetical protein
MSFKDPAYVIFDGDEDKWAYSFMRGWKVNDNVDFDFRDAHDLGVMTSRAQDEAYVKSQLKLRMQQSKSVIVLVGEKTKNLFKFVRWELELATTLGLPIIVVNLNNQRQLDAALCPAIIRDQCAVHVPFKLAAIRHALEHWPREFRGLSVSAKAQGARRYSDAQYTAWGL